MDDAQLLRALAGGLDGAFEVLVLAYQDRLYRFGLRLTGSGEDAEEIAQDAFVRAYHALGRYAPERITGLALRPWLYQIALNVFRNRVRRPQPQTVMLDGQAEGIEGKEGRPEALALASERTCELARLVAALPGRYRAPVVLRHIEDLSIGEIAEITQQPEGTVKSNIHRGMRLLRQAVETERSEVTV